jgi:hypothetical protein
MLTPFSPHIVSECYKTFWVFITGWGFVLANIWRGNEPHKGQLLPDFGASTTD